MLDKEGTFISPVPTSPTVPPGPPLRNLSVEFVVTQARATPVEEIICASGPVITKAECETAVTKVAVSQNQPEIQHAAPHSFLYSSSPLLSLSLQRLF